MGGILKNKIEEDQQQNVKLTENTKEFRSQVLKNTKLNALLKNNINSDILNEQGEIDPSKINQLSEDDKEKLKWNAENLKDNEVIQKQIIENLGQSIDEPKTPFQHATQPELNEYYQDDDEIEELDGFSLGEPELKVDELDQKFDVKVNPEEKLNTTEEDGNDEQEEEEKPKKTFEELRKQHYHNESLPKDVDFDMDEEEEKEHERAPKKSFAELRKQHYHNEIIPAVTKRNEEDDEEEDE